jgi:hypothetical protein
MSDVHESLLWFPDAFVNRRGPVEGRRDSLLPGRLLQAMNKHHRERLVAALNGSPPADWWIKIVCGK